MRKYIRLQIWPAVLWIGGLLLDTAPLLEEIWLLGGATKQNEVARGSAEAEYRSMPQGICEML